MQEQQVKISLSTSIELGISLSTSIEFGMSLKEAEWDLL